MLMQKLSIVLTAIQLVKGKFPSDMPGPLQYGNGLKAYIISLLVCQMISLNRVQKMIKSTDWRNYC